MLTKISNFFVSKGSEEAKPVLTGIQKPANSNYCATVVKIKNVITLENCDNVAATSIFGFQAIINKSVQVGDVGIVFPAESQLSDEYCKNNNLYRHFEKNLDPTEKGYIEDNRRVRAIKFRGNNSSCFFMPLSSLSFVLSEQEIKELADKEGTEFDTLNGIKICEKYVVPTKPGRGFTPAPKRFTRVDEMHMPEHMDSDNYHKWGDTIPDDKIIIVTQKLHGTSIRVGNTIVKRKLKTVEKLARLLGGEVKEHEHDYIYGSRKVIKDINNPFQAHYYGSDIWTKEGEKLNGLIPKNYLVYAELIGWTGETPIQSGYTYSIDKGVCEMYIYRIAIVNEDGHLTDLAWDSVKEFCSERGLKHVPELWRGLKKDFNVNDWMNKRYSDFTFQSCPVPNPNVVPLGDNKDLVDEGVCVRVDGMRPRILKAKCSKFFEHETKLLDEGNVDLETAGEETNPENI